MVNEVPIPALVQSFAEIAPGFSAKLIIIPNENYTTYLEDLIRKGEEIDLFWVSNNAQYSDCIAAGLAAPLDDYIMRDMIDVVPYGITYTNIQYQGKPYMLPVRNSVWVLYYNKDLFDAAGVPYPQGSMSYTEYRALAKRMTSGAAENKIWGAYFHTWPICWTRYAIQQGYTVIDTNLAPFAEALQLRLDMQKDGSVIPYTQQIAEGANYRTEFINGSLAMHIMGDYHISQLRTAEQNGELDFDWDIVASPIPDGVSANTTNSMPGGFCLSAFSQHPDAAWEFLKYISGEIGAEAYAKAGYVPAYSSEKIHSMLIYDGIKKPANIQILLDQKVYVEYPPVSGIAEIDKIYEEEAAKALAGEKSVTQAVDDIAARIRALNLSE